MEAQLASETDLAGFREEARSLLAHQVPPEAVQWQTARAENSDHFCDPVAMSEDRRGIPKAASGIVPASFLRLCEMVVLHTDPSRFALLYRLLWRLVHEPALRNDPVDPDMPLAQAPGHNAPEADWLALYQRVFAMRQIRAEGEAQTNTPSWYAAPK